MSGKVRRKKANKGVITLPVRHFGGVVENWSIVEEDGLNLRWKRAEVEER